jgi:hypothetical protein
MTGIAVDDIFRQSAGNSPDNFSCEQEGRMATKTGYVNGIDVIAFLGAIRCLAEISDQPHGSPDEIQVYTGSSRLQSILESASARSVKITVTYEDSGAEEKLTRVTVDDRL